MSTIGVQGRLLNTLLRKQVSENPVKLPAARAAPTYQTMVSAAAA